MILRTESRHNIAYHSVIHTHAIQPNFGGTEVRSSFKTSLIYQISLFEF